jgi:hypothetical protein
MLLIFGIFREPMIAWRIFGMILKLAAYPYAAYGLSKTAVFRRPVSSDFPVPVQLSFALKTGSEEMVHFDHAGSS